MTDTPAQRYREAARDCINNLLNYGIDRYGPVETMMLMSIMDVRTNESPREPLLLEAEVRSEGRPGRRNPGGCDLWDDQPLLRALYHYSALCTNRQYARHAEAYIRAFFARARKPNGMLAWGLHLFYDAFTDEIGSDGVGSQPHEMVLQLAQWEGMWRADPEGVAREIEGIWQYHIVDKATGMHNRHDEHLPEHGPICDFAFTGSSYAHAFAFMYSVTHEAVWLERAKLVANWHWSHRDPATNLAPDTPTRTDRFDGQHCFSTVTGPHAGALLLCAELTGDAWFREVAVAYVKAWLKYAWDEAAGKFYAAVRLDGTPVPEGDKGEGYDAWLPRGWADTWPTTVGSYDQPLYAAQTCLKAYELTRDPELLAGARQWARHIRGDLPPAIGRRWREEIYALLPEARTLGGAYAEGYGRAVLFFTGLYRATGEREDLETARALADEAMEKLGENGWLKGHAAKPYYETTDGVGLLLCGLLELSTVKDQ